MEQSPNLNTSVLQNYGGMERNCLLNITKQTDDNPDEINLFQNSPYVSHDQFLSVMHKIASDFTVLSLNRQSLNAKYNKIQCFLQSLYNHNSNFNFSAICLQETWLSDLDVFFPPSNWIIIPAFPRAKNVLPMEALLSISTSNMIIR